MTTTLEKYYLNKKISRKLFKNIKNENWKDLLEEKLNEHIACKVELINMLEEKANEWSINYGKLFINT